MPQGGRGGFWSCSSIALVGNFYEMNGSGYSIAEILGASGLCAEATRLECRFVIVFSVHFALILCCWSSCTRVHGVSSVKGGDITVK